MAGFLVLKRNNVPLLVGAVVHFHKKPAYIREMNERTGFVYIVTMDERAEYLRARSEEIGAIWSH